MLAPDPFRALVALTLFSVPTAAAAQCLDYADGIRYVGDIGNAPESAYTDDVASDESLDVLYRAVHGNHVEYGVYATTYVYDVSVPGTITVLGTVPDCSIPDGCSSFTEISAGDGILAGLLDDSLYVGDAADPSNISLVSMPMAEATVTAVAEDYVYVLGTDFVVVDVSSPGVPVEVGRVTLGISGDAMVATGNVAYVAGGAAGLHVVDASDETNPQLSGTLQLAHDATHIDRRGSLLYIASDTDVTVVDVTSPLAPTIRGTLAIPTSSGLAAADGYVVTGEGQLLHLVDVADPDAPFEAGVLTKGATCIGDGGPGPTVSKVAVSAGGDLFWFGREFVSSSTFESSHHFSALPAPGDPRLATIPTPAMIEDVVIDGDFAYALAEDGVLHVVDLSDPLAPVFRGSIDTGDDPHGIDVEGGLACVADRTDGLYVVDVSDPDAPTVVGFGPQPVLDVAIDGSYVYASTAGASANRLFVSVDISSPSAPQIVGGAPLTGIDAITLFGDHAYVGRGWPDDAFYVIDISAPLTPVAIGTTPIAADPSKLIVHGSIVYGSGGSTVFGVDVSNPELPTSFDVNVDPCVSLGSIATLGAVLYSVAWYHDGAGIVSAIDISDPTAPAYIGSATVGGESWSAAASSGTHLYGFGSALSALAPQCGIAVAVGDALGTPPSVASVLSVHPLPVRGTATIRFLGELGQGAAPAGHVLDVQGRLVGDIPLRPEGTGYAGTWDARALPSGVYFVRVPAATGPVTRRIVRVE